jgi:hypothetical protein
MSDDQGTVELTTVQPFEAQVIVAKLKASGIPSSTSPDAFPYDSISQADGVSIYVAAADASRARALLDEGREDE